jgi:phosphoglucomutase/phosphomannomutase
MTWWITAYKRSEMGKDDLDQRINEVSRQPNGGPEAALVLRDWVTHDYPFVETEEVLRFAAAAPIELIVDSFRCTIPFGTGGRRGRVGIGPNRLNQRTLALTVAGHAEYLRKTSFHDELQVLIANDTRVFNDISASHNFMGNRWSLRGITSRDLAILAAKIYAFYDIKTLITSPRDSSAYMPTPELSFAIRALGADGGLNVSASHNHPDDNGLKVFTPSGGQYCPPDDEDLADTVERVTLDPAFEMAAAKLGNVADAIPEFVHKQYIDLYINSDKQLRRRSLSFQPDIPIVYTPMCGTGLASVGEVLEGAGYSLSVPPGHYPDGSFAAIPMRSPNPEIPGVTEPATRYASSIGVDLVLSTDPDADRLGVEVRLPSGEWRHLTGNQIAALLAYFLVADEAGPKLSGTIISTVATSKALEAISALATEVKSVNDLMIGFKFIGQRLDSTEQGPSVRLVLAAEESHGYLTTDRLRDKDAASAAYIVAHIHNQMRHSGHTVWDYLMRIYERIGIHIELGRYLILPGAQGADAIASVMRSLREDPIRVLGGETVVAFRDFWKNATGSMTEGEKVSKNVLEMATEHYRMVVRPSGTEAKLKYYFDYHERLPEPGRTREFYEEREGTARRACSLVYADLAQRAGYTLSSAALELPDTMTLQEKAATQ